MKKIAIMELDYHFEVLLNTCRIFDGIDIDVTIITKEKYANELLKAGDFNSLKWILWKSSESLTTFLQKNINLINGFDLLLINTFSKYFKEFVNVELKPKTVLRIHNGYAYFAPKQHLKFANNLYYLLVDLKYFVKEILFKNEWKYREEFRKKIDYFLFPTETIRKYAITQNYTSEEQAVNLMPWSLASNEFTTINNKDEVYITLTGSVDIRRRNYKQLHAALAKAKDKFQRKVVLTFLGKPKNKYEKNTINSFKKLENDHLKFVAYSGWVPQNDFDNVMAKTDFLVIPLYKDVKFTIYSELYGYTKISGNVNDIILYSRPALISSFYPLESNLKNVTESFEDTVDLAGKLVKWVNEKSFMNYETELNELREMYSLNNIQKEVKKVIESIL